MPETRVEIDGLDELVRTLRGTDRDVRKDVVKVNRKWTNKLRDKIRLISPRTGGTVGRGALPGRRAARGKEGPRHDTRPGAFQRSIRSHVSERSGRIEGGGGPAPHFIVNEFGGAVWWHRMGAGASRLGPNAQRSNLSKQRRAKVGHIIPVRLRSPMTAAGGATTSGGRKFPKGWYFFPTIDENAEPLLRDYWDEMCKTLDRKLR